MKSLFLAGLIVLTSASAIFAQTETLDLARFTPPAGWLRAQHEGALLLETRRMALGRAEFCKIYVFPSRPVMHPSEPAEDFKLEFMARTSRIMYVPTLPRPQSGRNPDGSTTLTGYADFITQGMQGSRAGLPAGTSVRALLVTYLGGGRIMGILVLVSPNSYVRELEGFFDSVRLRSNGPPRSGAPPLNAEPRMDTPTSGPLASGAGPIGTPPLAGANGRTSSSSPASGSLANYAFDIPQGWRQTESRNRIVLLSPMYQGGEQCQLTMEPMHSASQPLPNEAVAFYRQAFRIEPLAQYAYAWPKLYRGISPQGWEYFMIRKSIGGSDGDVGTIVFLAQAGGQIATIVGVSKRPLVSNCFGELVRDQWPAFYYSLQFKNAQPSGDEQAAIQKRLAGEWITATASVGLHYSFDGNGRYDDTGAARHVTRVSPLEVVVTTNAYFGNGSYTFEGNTIVFKSDDGKRTVNYFRLQQESADGGRTWSDGFCLLDPGATGEVCYQRGR